MKALFSVLLESFRAELLQLSRSLLFVALTIVLAVTFLFLVSLFALTGSRAPTAIVNEDQGPYARAFITQLAVAHHSFALRPMDEASAVADLHMGRLVAIITIPKGFSSAIANGQEVTLPVAIDNVNTDMTDDIQRALPSAIVAFGREYHLPGIRIHLTEVDLIDHDTGFIPYLVVSGLALDAFLIATVLSAMAVAREFETGTIKLLAVTPVPPLISILGRMLATDMIATVAMIFPIALAVVAYHIIPLHPLEMIGVILICIAIFGCIGVALGALLKRTLPLVSLIIGLGFPLYLCSGSLEPQRFDGNLIWAIAHLSPLYYAVGILEQAFHGLQVTPEPLWVNFSVLLGWALLMLLLAGILLRKALFEKSSQPQVATSSYAVAKRQLHRQRSQLVFPYALWLFVVLIPLLIGGSFWLRQQQQQANILLHQQQQRTLQAFIEGRRETRLLNYYTQSIYSLLKSNDPRLYVNIADPARVFVSTFTQDTLLQLDPEHKVALLGFIYKEKLIDDDYHVVSLRGVDFHACSLAGFNLSDTDLSGANFSDADMRNVKLSSSTLVAVNFNGTNLAGADLEVSDMHYADVRNANLSGADLVGVIGMNIEQLIQAHSLAGTKLPDGSVQPGEVKDTD